MFYQTNFANYPVPNTFLNMWYFLYVVLLAITFIVFSNGFIQNQFAMLTRINWYSSSSLSMVSYQLPVNCASKILNGKFKQLVIHKFKLHTLLNSMMKSCSILLYSTWTWRISVQPIHAIYATCLLAEETTKRIYGLALSAVSGIHWVS